FTHDPLTDVTADLEIKIPGVFEYYVEYEDWQSLILCKSEVIGSFIVEPRLYVPNGNGKALLPLDGISILTVIPKWMPTIDLWEPFFAAFNYSNFNMVHYAPMNERGISNSPYSIYDQLMLSNDMFKVPMSEPEKENFLKYTLDKMYNQYGIMHVIDVVWNHTACNSEWLQHHPEAGYNLRNSPHLRPAYDVDEAILVFSEEIESKYNLPSNLKTEAELQAVLNIFQNVIIPDLKLWEYYVLDIPSTVLDFRLQWNIISTNIYSKEYLNKLSAKDRAEKFMREIVINETYTRKGKKIRAKLAAEFVKRILAERNEEMTVDNGLKIFEEIIKFVNLLWYEEYDDDLKCIFEQTTHRARFLRVADHGPRLGALSRENPLVDTYFTRLPRNEVTKNLHQDDMALACNGWIWNADPLLNFAGPQSKAYLRREVIAWGDCVKLRYGEKPVQEDNPWIWEHQKSYTEKMARLFHGFRIDNCHSTPINLASYLLDSGRRVRPDLYVFAELFTGSEEKDVHFVAKMGLNSLIREGMNAWDSFELSRLVHRYGGEPVGSLTFPPEHLPLDLLGHKTNSKQFKEVSSSQIVIDVKGSKIHTLFMDCTHDNETPNQKRTAEDTLPHAALVAMSNCAIGSVKGFDELVPNLLNVVTETRKYRAQSEMDGIVPVRKTLNELHTKMAREGYNEVHVHHENGYISVHRVHPQTHDGYLLIARTAFNLDKSAEVHSPIRLRNQRVKIIESATLKVLVNQTKSQSQPYMDETHSLLDKKETKVDDTKTAAELATNSLSASQLYHHIPADEIIILSTSTNTPEFSGTPTTKRRMSKSKSTGIITGLPCLLDYDDENSNLIRVYENRLDDGDFETVIECNGYWFAKGSTVLLRTIVDGSGIDDVDNTTDGVLTNLWKLLGLNCLSGVENMVRMGWDVLGSGRMWLENDGSNWAPGLWEAIKVLKELEINVVLFRSEMEERDTIDDGAYEIPGFGKLTYCGLQGFVS
ncbi:hypothetical protein HK096_003443, partial [Nowakowskiella sp. JEL0078]